MPEGNLPPLWQGDEVIFEAKGGVYAVDASHGTLRWMVSGADWPHVGPGGIVLRRGGASGKFERIVR